MSFTELLRPLVSHLRNKWDYRVLPYIDDFLLAPSPAGRVTTEKDGGEARSRLERLFQRLGLRRHATRGCWAGSRQVDHLGVHIDTEAMKVYLSEAKRRKMLRLSKEFLILVQRNWRLVSLEKLRHFCRVAVSLTLAVPLERFYTRSLYFDMSRTERE